MNRRQFLKLGAAATTTLAAARFVPTTFAAEKPKRAALIGSGWYGKCDLFRLLQVAPVEVVALCDADAQLLTEAADLVAARQTSKQRPRTYKDYRQLLQEQSPELVLIATPDHWHALPMIAACQAGADVYVQKPIGVDVVECQAMLTAARKHRRVVQVGTQRRSTPHLIEARDQIVREGKLGRVGAVEIYCYYHMRNQSVPPDTDPPAHLDYDLWTGPAPLRPYNRLVHPRGWRGFMEYGNGIVGDMAIHMFDMVRWMLDLGWPKRISSTGGILVQKNKKVNISDTQTATFDYGDLQVIWQHRTYGAMPDPQYPWGATIYGDKGTLKAGLMSYDFIPQGSGEAIHRECVYELEAYPEDKTEKDLEKHVAPAIRGHMRDFVACIESRAKPVADIEQGCISSACCILANVALQVGRTLAWDAAAGRVTGDDEANQLLRRPYRAPWVHPDPARV
ncbi:MAG TPA: Gfo/Idh/MocA family oxidoreductase [Verrucomicrobiota bacterium]|nr:MAG: Inositol 2-dehydrogenase [Verrucomicrobia bacterium ADurb.Bin118]HPY30762.1 Gfo/Idh/MocA family oxidoreductase [Verrucomicrobiota bacterium]HQB17146.1 Gfo/Idh/MocA family oxidoreductase [Verrucomicrobiota bacterium]